MDSIVHVSGAIWLDSNGFFDILDMVAGKPGIRSQSLKRFSAVYLASLMNLEIV